MRRWVFWAAGRPRTKGSTRSFLSREGRMVTKGANPKTRAWQGVIAHAACEAGVERSADGVRLDVVFCFARPKAHYGSGRNAGTLKASAPKRPTTRSCGDLDKLLRAVLDALTGVAFADDSEVTGFGDVRKVWLDSRTDTEGARITVAPSAVEALEANAQHQGVDA